MRLRLSCKDYLENFKFLSFFRDIVNNDYDVYLELEDQVFYLVIAKKKKVKRDYQLSIFDLDEV